MSTKTCFVVAGLFLFAMERQIWAEGDAEKDKWIAIQKTVEVETKDKDGNPVKKQAEISNICVDRNTGDLLAFINGSGLWKSADQGGTFTQIHKTAGNCDSSFSLVMDPNDGKRIMCLLLGGPSVLTLDGGKTWLPVNQQSHCVVVDWNDPEAKTIAARRSGHDTWMLSQDQGKTFKSIKPSKWNEQWYSAFGAFDSRIFVFCSASPKEGIRRSEDGDGTYTNVAAFSTRKNVIHIVGKHGYVLAQEGLAVSLDKGKTWNAPALPKDTAAGPYFGKDENHIIVASPKEGFLESRDAGKTWKNVAKFPFVPADLAASMNHGDTGTCGYDPVHDVFYLCSRGHAVQKYRR